MRTRTGARDYVDVREAHPRIRVRVRQKLGGGGCSCVQSHPTCSVTANQSAITCGCPRRTRIRQSTLRQRLKPCGLDSWPRPSSLASYIAGSYTRFGTYTRQRAFVTARGVTDARVALCNVITSKRTSILPTHTNLQAKPPCELAPRPYNAVTPKTRCS